MKRQYLLSMLLFPFFTLAQEKPIITDNNSIIEYLDIQHILSNKEELQLNSKQEVSFVLKNEHVKRDLLFLNNTENLLPIEIKEAEKKIKNEYQFFIERNLDNDQFELWEKIKKEIEDEENQDLGIKKDLELLKQNALQEEKEIFNKYKNDRKIYIAQRNVRKKKNAKTKSKISEYYNAPVKENDVLSLEEIKNLIKEYENK